MSLAQDYLAERGLTEETAQLYGLELDSRLSQEIIKGRLGRQLSKSVNEIIWIPITDATGSVVDWIARLLPKVVDLPKFVCAIGSDGAPFIVRNLYKLAHGLPVIIAESPIKAIVCDQAGVPAAGINGVWGAAIKNEYDSYVIRADLGRVLDWRGRQVYLAFDADWLIKPDVRQAVIRTLFRFFGSRGGGLITQVESRARQRH